MAAQLTAAERVELGARALLGADNLKGLGPFFLGAILDVLMFGIVMHQGVTYCHYSWHTDTKFLRVLVVWVLVLAILSSIFHVIHIWWLFAFNYGLYTPFLHPIWAPVGFLMSCTSRIAAGGYFAIRAWKMCNRSKLVAATFITLFIVSFAGSFGLFFASNTINITTTKVVLVMIWGIPEVISDLMATGMIAVGLYRSRTGWVKTDALVSRLMRVVAETQLPPTVISIAFIAVYVHTVTQSATYAWIFKFTPKVHVLCLFSVLNGRVKLRQIAEASGGGKVYASGAEVASNVRTGAAFPRLARRVDIQNEGVDDFGMSNANASQKHGIASFLREGPQSPRSVYFARDDQQTIAQRTADYNSTSNLRAPSPEGSVTDIELSYSKEGAIDRR